MSDRTHIEWTDASWSPTTGCDRVSPGCSACYALAMAGRLKLMGSPKYQRDGDPRTSGPGFGVTEHPHTLDLPLKWRKPRRVFVDAMSDLFHDQVSDDFIARVFAVMGLAQRHTFQVLTKRPGRMASLLNSERFRELVGTHGWGFDPQGSIIYSQDSPWPFPNVWLGVSVEDQKWGDVRIPKLLETPAAIRFLSCEPLLGPLDLTAWMPPGYARWRCSGCLRLFTGPLIHLCPNCGRVGYWSGSHTGNGRPNGQPLGWTIVGGESGPGARPMDLAWARRIVEQCRDAGVPVFVKQLGSVWARQNGQRDKGGDIDRWPEDLRVRQMPDPALAGAR